MNVLVVEDDPAEAALLERVTRSLGHQASLVCSGERAVKYIRDQTVDLVVLDWCLPGMSGLDVLRWIRANYGVEITVVFVTAKAFEGDIVTALDAGADEYIVKPCRESELAARLNALWRRHDRERKFERTMRAGRYVLDTAMQTISLKGEPISLTTKEFALIAYLFENCGRVVSRDLLGKLVWGKTPDGLSRSLDTHIYRIRRKLALRAENGLRLSAVYTHGYRLDEVESPDEDS
ncbi:MAG: Sensory transduction protein regX3 [Burkholderia lata]|uniref:Sensory transduction protein regX3 n=1 Tax=Burkholderia lata (strain ATCC 17760 / DSM 23089 / LMG 22485 / NCIMB 9086 / R18194 / 383) TaxID=482957 RepID=A0A833PTX0_BURL3|nr:response regulator transcription factor [Burkholderia lata]KAF1036135.1 MAG: Sensory transduction protein regX3 [Burkholderia lata]